jgi:hypothetical protein
MCLNATTPETVAEDFLSKTENWNNKARGTMVLMQDWGVMLFYEAYLTEFNVIVNSLNKGNACKGIIRTNKKKKPKKQKTKGKKHEP